VSGVVRDLRSDVPTSWDVIERHVLGVDLVKTRSGDMAEAWQRIAAAEMGAA
jgi:hypothetical protein